jgi:phage terminase large subunit-like protein
VWDVLDHGITARRQPLIYAISTEGDAASGIFADQVHYLQQILDGTHQDESYFGIYYGLDPEDDWTLEESWIKANPNWDVSVSPREMRDKFREAKQLPAAQTTFLTKRLNVRVGAGSAYFNMLAWRELCCDVSLKIEDFRGLPCIVTVDLASKSDLAAWVATFRRGGHYYAFGRYYIPESAIEPGRPNYDFYRGWRTQELLTVTDGARTNYEVIEQDLLQFRDIYKPQRVGVDPNYNAEQFRQHMEAAGVPIIEIPHTVLQFSEPMKDLASLIPEGRIHSNGDPIMTWAMSNVIAKVDAKGNVYPRKAREENKIDPAVMLIAGMSQWLRFEAPRQSIYATMNCI